MRFESKNKITLDCHRFTHFIFTTKETLKRRLCSLFIPVILPTLDLGVYFYIAAPDALVLNECICHDQSVREDLQTCNLLQPTYQYTRQDFQTNSLPQPQDQSVRYDIYMIFAQQQSQPRRCCPSWVNLRKLQTGCLSADTTTDYNFTRNMSLNFALFT